MFLLEQLKLKLVFITVTGCDGTLTGTKGNFTSPGYPSDYQDSLICIWRITVDSSSRVQIEFSDFKVEASNPCQYDYLLIKDGTQDESPVIAKLCGSNIPSPVLSFESEIIVQFHSDRAIGLKGFRALWKAVPKVQLIQPSGNSFCTISQ